MTLSESWIPLDIDTEEPAIPVRPGPGQNVVGMVATPAARERGWSRRAAIEICRGWAQDGSRILLCDVAFEEPELHEVAGLYNQEGVSDALLFGTSFRRLGQPLADGFFLATAGTAVPDPAALRSHPRWNDFAGGFTEAGAVLVLYLPSDAPGVESLYELCDTVVVLGERREVDDLSLSSALGPLATFGPHPDAAGVGGRPEAGLAGVASAEVPGVSAASASDTDSDDAGRQVPSGDPGDDGGAHTTPDSGAEELVGATASLTGTESTSRDAGRHESAAAAVDAGGRGSESAGSGGIGGRLLWGAVALVVLLVVLNLAGVIGGADPAGDPSSPGEGDPGAAVAGPEAEAGNQGGATVVEAESAATAVPDPGPMAGPRGLEAAPVARFVLAVASYETLSAAFRDVVALRNAMPQAHFVISPVRVNGRVWYRMSAGSGESAGEVVELRDGLAARRPEAEGWQVREAGLSYLVDEYPRFSEADERVALLAEQGVPAHVLRYLDDAGVERFRVYAGAYRSPAEAGYLGEFLQDAAPELRDLPLVERRGSRPG